MITLFVFCILLLLRTAVVADPISKPYVAFRTSPFDTAAVIIPFNSTVQEEAATPLDPILNQCASPLNITIKHSTPTSKSHASSPVIVKPVIYPLHSHGPNQSILFLHFREVLDMVNFGNLDHKEDSFPMLFQGSTFLASPIITDVNLDGIEDAILVDYNGLITSIGLATSVSQNENGQRRRHRFFRERDIPKLYVRKDWVKHACNGSSVEEFTTQKSNLQPFHSYFEYSSEWTSSHKVTTSVRGEHADIIKQSVHTIKNIEHHRRLDEESSMDEYHSSATIGVDDIINAKHDTYYQYDDDYFQHFGDSSYHEAQRKFYKDENYIPLPPHVLSTPKLFHVKQDPHSDLIHAKYDEYLAIAVSYYFDEDEHRHYYGDAGLLQNMTEAIRGQYMATAIIIYNLQQNAFTQEIHLDMSTDFTAPSLSTLDSFGEDENVQWNDENYNGFISLALASPTPVDLEDDGRMEILMGTSMGRIYCVCATLGDEIFTVQMPGRIEKPIVADNLLSGEGYEHLEILAVDSLGNIVCLTSKGVAIWTKELISGVTVKSTSDIILSDMDGDGQIDIVLSVITDKYLYLYALQSSDGSALDGYPKEFQIESALTSEYRLPSPIVASSTVIQAVGSKLYIIDKIADCIHDYDLGDSIVTLVSGDADGDDGLDVIATTRGGIVALDTSISTTSITTNSIGIHVDKSNRIWHNFHGTKIPVRFSIFDNGPDKMNVEKKYPIEMVVARSSTKVIFRKEYIQDESHFELVPFPFPPGFYSVTIRMRIDGRIFEDVFHFGFNVDPYVLMMFKWIILVPLFLSLIMLLFFMPIPISERENRGKDTLPSHLD